MSDDEEVTLLQAARDAAPVRVAPVPGKGALGTWRSRGGAWTQGQGKPTPEAGTSPMGKPMAPGVYVSQHLSLAAVGKASGGKPRSEPDSGNPTVRDRRGACGNVRHGSRIEAHEKTHGRATEPYSETRRTSIPTERPTRPRIWWGESPHAVSCPIRTASISDAREGNDPCSART